MIGNYSNDNIEIIVKIRNYRNDSNEIIVPPGISDFEFFPEHKNKRQ